MPSSAGSLLVLLATALLIAAVAFHPAAAAAPASPKKSKTAPPSSSVVFPLYGDVYPQGFYYVEMNIGDPPKPYFLDVDSGSDLTWLQCDAPCVNCQKCPHPWYRPSRSNLVGCKDPRCTSLRISTGQLHGSLGNIQNGCGNDDSSAEGQCDYEINYADSGSSLGVLVADNFAMRLTNGSIVHPALAFGCGYDQQGGGTTSPTDGVLGLGRGPSGVLAQLSMQGITRNVVGHCLSRRGGGFLVFGGDLVPASGVTWVPMSTNRNSTSSTSIFTMHPQNDSLQKQHIDMTMRYYSPGPAGLYYGKDSLIKEMQLVFDSGSSYTYFGMAPYQALITKMKKDLTGKPLEEADEDQTLPLCWKGPKPFKSLLDVRKYFRMLVLSFLSGKRRAQLEVPPESYLIVSRQGNACLGILNGTEIGLNDNLNIIGDISLQDLMVVYDNERQQIGWIQANCDRLPNADESAAGFQEVAICHSYISNIDIQMQQCPSSYS